MSGGSYRHMCHQDGEDLLRYEKQLARMATALKGVGALNLADRTQELASYLEDFRELVETKTRELREAWRVIEWRDSGDLDYEQAARIVQEELLSQKLKTQ